MSKFFKALEQAQRDRQASGGAPQTQSSQVPLPPEEQDQSEDPVSVFTESGPEDALAAPPSVEIPSGVDEHLVSLLTPAAFEAEQYRALRHTVEQLHKSTGLRVLAVSSPTVGDGKTTTAINLAGALAQAVENRVLLVDADLRRPSLGRLLGLGQPMGPGLVDAIVNPTLGIEQIAQDRPPFNLDVIRAGQSPPSPYEVFKSPRVGTLLDEARQRYDYVVVDAPPMVPVQDCRVIGRWLDGFLLVVQAHRTPRRLLEEALNIVDPSKMLGLVFNGDEHPSSGYYGYYRYYARDPSVAPNGHGRPRLGRAVTRFGQMLRRRRGRRR